MQHTCPVFKKGWVPSPITPGPPWLVSHSAAATVLPINMRHPFKLSEFWRENTNRGTQLPDSQHLSVPSKGIQNRAWLLKWGSLVIQAGLKLVMQLRRTLNCWSSCLYPLNAVATGMHSTSGLHSAKNWTQGFMRTGQALYQWHHIPRSGCLDLRFCFFSTCFLLCKPGRNFHIFLGVHVHTQRAIHWLTD